MTYPAIQLITRAWYTSGIVARQLQTVSGDQGSDGLWLLNELLDFKAADLSLIPYWRRYSFNMVQGQEDYFIPNLYQVETSTFNIGVVRFPMSNQNRTRYFGAGRVDNIQSLPFTWHLERGTGGSTIRFYFLPADNYLCQLTGKFALTDVSLTTDLSSVYDGFYIAYLRHALAEYMCIYYDVEFPADKKLMLTKMENKLRYISPPDLTMQKVRITGKIEPYDWQHINISPGYDV